MCYSLFKLFRSLLAGSALITSGLSSSMADCMDDAMLVFDGSGSMAEMGFNGLNLPRIFEAREAMRQSIPDVSTNRRLGLITYGPGTEESCSNISLEFPPAPEAAQRVIQSIEDLKPAGNTPLTAAVKMAADTLNFEEQPGEIVLVTDGKETCNGATCRLATDLAAGSLSLKIHVIGFQVRGDFFIWQSQKLDQPEDGEVVARCLADYTGGHYMTTETVDELSQALRKALGCSVIGENTIRSIPLG